MLRKIARCMLLLIVVLFAMWLTYAIYRYVEFYPVLAEKHGRVIDEATGKGIAGARVIVSWERMSSGLSNAVGCTAQRVVSTNASGEFVIPNMTLQLDWLHDLWGVWLPLVGMARPETAYSWNMTLYATGYVRRGDVEKITQDRGDPRAEFTWWRPPSVAHWTPFGFLYLASIQMQRVNLSLEAAAIYYDSIGRVTSCLAESKEQPEVADILKEMSAPLTQLACDASPTVPISYRAVSGIAGVYRGTAVFERIRGLLRAVEPTKKIPAGLLCKALKGEIDQ